jgi:DNA sulfur modification protein DndD
MDAPFSPADGDHISNICRVLPGIAEQVIMFIMQKDWSFAEIELGDLVGSEYRLDKKSETLTYIREVKRHV